MVSRRRFIVAGMAAALLPAASPAATAFAQTVPAPGALSSLVGLPGIGAAPLAADEIAGRPVVVVFWASWCPPCRPEFLQLNRLHAAYDERVAIIAVNVHEAMVGEAADERRARFLAAVQPGFRVLEGHAGLLDVFGGVASIPAVFIFDSDGEVAFIFAAETGGKGHVTAGELGHVLRNMGLAPRAGGAQT